MSKNPAKDFGPIADDYVFFETHATEAANDARAYVERLAAVVPATRLIRLLDFGCGSGSFTMQFLQQAGWPRERLELTLIEPVEAVRRQAVSRLGNYTALPISDAAVLPSGIGGFDLVLANHCLYYVPELRSQLARLVNLLRPTGVFVTAIAARPNALVEIWITGFGLLGKEIPYNTAEDVEAALQQLGAGYQKQQVPYELSFPDTEENRLRILRFLLADHLAQMPRQPLLDMFHRYVHLGRIRIHTASEHFTVRPPLRSGI